MKYELLQLNVICLEHLKLIDPLHDDVRHQNNPRRALHCGRFSGVRPTGCLLTRKTMVEALILFREVDIKGVVLPEKVVDKNTREALTRWISREV